MRRGGDKENSENCAVTAQVKHCTAQQLRAPHSGDRKSERERERESIGSVSVFLRQQRAFWNVLTTFFRFQLSFRRFGLQNFPLLLFLIGKYFWHVPLLFALLFVHFVTRFTTICHLFFTTVFVSLLTCRFVIFLLTLFDLLPFTFVSPSPAFYHFVFCLCVCPFLSSFFFCIC